ncbi:hypothetical protein D0T12_32340 [Actinomadura spongiicola]|uniref:WD40 repeat domain-containing protein n=1 Tax=Actinomadura spongiicola TaxID=2303421 RepID=A0A372G7G8_9ACTN|nr:hypothetical protein D0T12_32340 [Actinomadura spongiicola]
MTPPFEDVLRSALSEGADTVESRSLRPLAEPSTRRRRVRVVPLGGLVVAVAAAVVLVVLAPWSQEGDAPPRFSFASYMGAEYVLDGAWPPGGMAVNVRKADTGRLVAEVAAPRGSSGFRDSAGAGDNRTFVLTTADPDACRIRFHGLTLKADGTPAALTELPRTSLRGRLGEGPGLLAVAPGGRGFAYVSQTCGGQPHNVITVIDSSTGDRRVVDLPPKVWASSLGWAPDARHLVFESVTEGVSDGAELRMLDSANGDIRPVSLGSGMVLRSAAYAPDGAHVLVLVHDGRSHRLLWYSMDTGTVTRRVQLPRGESGATTGVEVAGGKVAVIVDETVHLIDGTKIKSSRPVEGGPPGTW